MNYSPLGHRNDAPIYDLTGLTPRRIRERTIIAGLSPHGQILPDGTVNSDREYAIRAAVHEAFKDLRRHRKIKPCTKLSVVFANLERNAFALTCVICTKPMPADTPALSALYDLCSPMQALPSEAKIPFPEYHARLKAALPRDATFDHRGKQANEKGGIILPDVENTEYAYDWHLSSLLIDDRNLHGGRDLQAEARLFASFHTETEPRVTFRELILVLYNAYKRDFEQIYNDPRVLDTAHGGCNHKEGGEKERRQRHATQAEVLHRWQRHFKERETLPPDFPSLPGGRG